MSVVDQVWYYYVPCTYVRTMLYASGVLSVGDAAQQWAVAVPIHPVNGSGGCLESVTVWRRMRMRPCWVRVNPSAPPVALVDGVSLTSVCLLPLLSITAT